MIKLHTLKPNRGAKHRKKRLGAGESSGRGKTSGKGHKGQKARSGGSIRPGFEGGQMPLIRRLPKRGFSNDRFKKPLAIVNIGDLERCFESGSTINQKNLYEKGLIRDAFVKVKILGHGEVTKSFIIQLQNISASAKEKIEKAGGSLLVVSS